MEEYQCIYCQVKEKDFNSIIDHVVIRHPESNLKIKIFNASESDQNKSSFYKNFNVWWIAALIIVHFHVSF